MLVKNQDGYEMLLRLLTKACLDGYYYRPRIGYDTLLNEDDQGLHGLVIMTGCCESFLSLPGGEKLLSDLQDRGADLALEVMPINIESQSIHNKRCIELSKDFGIPLVATADCHYVLKNDAKAQEVLLAIQRKAKWTDADRWKFTSGHLKSYREMRHDFEFQGVLSQRQCLSALAYTNQIAEMCNFEIPKREIDLPITRYEKRDVNKSADDILCDFCDQGIDKLFPNEWPDEYHDRMTQELNIIGEKGFARYFLIVKEIVDWCERTGIMVGPGRGSVGGSLVSMLCGITKPQIDPLKYGLLFERFISKDRLDYPDIDLDFENNKTDQVRAHLEQEYGEYNVAGISTFLRLKSKASVRDVGRVFALPAREVDTFAKAINPKEHDEEIIINAGKSLPEGQKFKRKYPDEFDLMCQLEGTIRTAGQHPAGLIVSASDLRNGERASLLRRSNKLVINWGMDDSEYAGLMKIDILKLDTLTVLNEARRLLQLQGEDVDYDSLPLDDPKVYKGITRGDLEGVFQLSGYATAQLCGKIKIENIEDIAAVISLSRPGPADSGQTDQYVARKKGQTWKPLHPAYEKITEETYGVMTYQEQMMRAMVDLAGFSGNDADRIRKVIGKKRKASEFEPHRIAFLEGCQKMDTLTDQQAEEFWQGLLEWAHYGFNKSHAIEYAVIGYWTAYMKYHHPTEFICAQLTYGSNTEKMVMEAEKHGLKIVTPKVGISEPINWVAQDNLLYMPFVEINGVGEKDAQKCAKKKSLSGGKKKGFFDIEEVEEEINPEAFEDKLQRLLYEIKAFDLDPNARPDDCLSYFQYNLSEPACDINGSLSLQKRRAVIDQGAKKCNACKLRKQADQVVLSDGGIYNALALAEAPGKEENSDRKGLVGPAGRLFWEEIWKYNIARRMIHVGNVCKCYPSKTKNPTKGEIDTCFNRWMIDEINSMDCKLILAMGGSAVWALKGEAGIVHLNAKMEWVPKVQAWVVFCVHPSAVLRNRPYYLPMFEKAIERFAYEFNKLKG
jgi:DNA polymerase-3 subunit alpha